MKPVKIFAGMLAVSLFALLGLTAPSPAQAEEVALLPGEHHEFIDGEYISGNCARDFQFSMDRVGAIDIGLYVSERNDSSSLNGISEFTLSDGAGNELDRIQYDPSDKSGYAGRMHYTLPAGHYQVHYRQTRNDDQDQYVSLWAAYFESNFNGTNYQVPLPGCRTIEKAAPIALDKELALDLNWYYARTYENRYYDRHYYRFSLTTPQALKFLMFGPRGETRLSLLDSNGNAVKVEPSVYDPGEDRYVEPILRTDDLGPGTYYLCVEAVERPRYDHNAVGELCRVNIKQAKDMYRMYNSNTGEHLYTDKAAERDGLVGFGWKYEGVMWKAPLSSDTPIYRLYNPNNGDHHYASTLEEYNRLGAVGWNQEGVAFYSNDYGIAVHRLYNSYTFGPGAHTYTTNMDEVYTLQNAGWWYEAVGWYGVDWNSTSYY